MNDDDFKLMRRFGDGQTDRQTYVIVELVSRLKKGTFITLHYLIMFCKSCSLVSMSYVEYVVMKCYNDRCQE